MRKKQLRALPEPVDLLPASLSRSLHCDSCGVEFPVDWLEKRPLENVVYPNAGSGRWQRTSVCFNCSECGATYSYPTDPRRERHRYDFFGDDARRTPDGSNDPFIYAYAFVGDGPQRLDRLYDVLRRIKEYALPEVPPEDWHLHTTEIFNPHSRRKSERFSHWDNDDARDFLIKAQREIAASPESAQIICGFAVAGKPPELSEAKFQRYMKEQVLMFLFLDTIWNTTDQEIVPLFVLESGSKDGAISEAYQAVAHTPVFSVVSHCVPIPEPTFEPKEPGTLTELADVVAFIVCRYCYRRVQGKKPELDPAEFGRILWYGFNKRGEPRRMNQVGFPWDEYFG